MNVITAILAAIAVAGISPALPVKIDGLQGLDKTRHHRVESEALGKGYDVFVGLPIGYEDSDDTEYPTVYILDGGNQYPLLKSYYGMLRGGNDIPDLILVAISYGTNDPESGNDRDHDYTAPSDERERYGGAEEFQRFLSDELVPFIEANYRSRADRRIVFGHSNGGQFILYSAQTMPILFWGHIASNPSMHRNLPLFLSMHPAVPATNERSYLFVGSGSHDDRRYLEPRLQWIDFWTAQQPKPWHLKVEVLDGHTHMSAPPAVFRRGLKWLFADQL